MAALKWTGAFDHKPPPKWKPSLGALFIGQEETDFPAFGYDQIRPLAKGIATNVYGVETMMWGYDILIVLSEYQMVSEPRLIPKAAALKPDLCFMATRYFMVPGGRYRSDGFYVPLKVPMMFPWREGAQWIGDEYPTYVRTLPKAEAPWDIQDYRYFDSFDPKDPDMTLRPYEGTPLHG